MLKKNYNVNQIETKDAPLLKITITGPEMNITRDIPEDRLPQLLSLILGPAPDEPNSGESMSYPGRSLEEEKSAGDNNVPESIVEFWRRFDPPNNHSKLLVLAAWKRRQEGKDYQFTAKDLAPLFKSVQEKTPALVSRDFNKAYKKGWFAKDEKQKNYYITRTGYSVLDAGFPNELRQNSGRPPKRGKATNKSSSSATITGATNNE